MALCPGRGVWGGGVDPAVGADQDHGEIEALEVREPHGTHRRTGVSYHQHGYAAAASCPSPRQATHRQFQQTPLIQDALGPLPVAAPRLRDRPVSRAREYSSPAPRCHCMTTPASPAGQASPTRSVTTA